MRISRIKLTYITSQSYSVFSKIEIKRSSVTQIEEILCSPRSEANRNQEVIPRELIWVMQTRIVQEQSWYLRVGSKTTWHSVGKMSSLLGTFADSLCQVIFVRSLRVGSKITWHSVSKMSGLYGTFADSLCQVIYERSLTHKLH